MLRRKQILTEVVHLVQVFQELWEVEYLWEEDQEADSMFDMNPVVEEHFRVIEVIRERVEEEAIPHSDNQALMVKPVLVVWEWQVVVVLDGTLLDLVEQGEPVLLWRCLIFKH